MPKKKATDDQLDLFAVAPKHLAKQFELEEVPGQDGKKAWDRERLSAYERNSQRPHPGLKPGDKVKTTYELSCRKLVFIVKEVQVSHTVCQSGYRVITEDHPEYKQRTGYDRLPDLDSGWFEKLLL